MEKQDRRKFLKISALLGTSISALPASKTKAAPTNILSEDRMGVLVDTTVCIGCRNCEWACKNSHGYHAGNLDDYSDRTVFNKKRRPDEKTLTVVNEFQNPKSSSSPFGVKVQCMHCDHPACVSACIVGAMSKQENGSVIWDTKKCIGCRYCMVACPFQIPTFTYDEPVHNDIVKCDFCFERTAKGELPACVDICPVEALTYGQRSDLIKIARKRIERNPERYVNHIYGENEVGGTSWLYLSGIDHTNLDFPKLKTSPAPGVSETIQHGIFAYFVPPVMLYALLGGIMWITKRRKELETEEK